jgi:hypothetical protein
MEENWLWCEGLSLFLRPIATQESGWHQKDSASDKRDIRTCVAPPKIVDIVEKVTGFSSALIQVKAHHCSSS